jgi:cytochrome P450
MTTSSLDGVEQQSDGWLDQRFDHNAPGHADTMRERYAEMRKSCPVMHADTWGGFYVLSRHEDIVGVLKDHRKFSSASGITIPRMTQDTNAVPTESDQPDHTHYRRVLWPFLTPAAVAGYEDIVRKMVTELINDFIETGRADVIEQLAKPIPAMVTGVFFGFTAEEGRRLYHLIDVMGTVGPLDPERGRAAGAELYEMLQASLDAARQNPGDDVSSAIVTYDYEGRTFTNEESLGVLSTSTSGALSTTVGAIAHAVHLLWQFPEQRKMVVDNPELTVQAVEEILRMESPAHCPARTVTEKCKIEGVTLEPGDRVMMLYDSANYDTAVFEDPEVFRLDRSNNPHLAFGQGIHKCEGQHLARLELRVFIEEFLRRIPDYEVVSTPTTATIGGLCLINNLHISFPPGKQIDVP